MFAFQGKLLTGLKDFFVFVFRWMSMGVTLISSVLKRDFSNGIYQTKTPNRRKPLDEENPSLGDSNLAPTQPVAKINVHVLITLEQVQNSHLLGPTKKRVIYQLSRKFIP